MRLRRENTFPAEFPSAALGDNKVKIPCLTLGFSFSFSLTFLLLKSKLVPKDPAPTKPATNAVLLKDACCFDLTALRITMMLFSSHAQRLPCLF